MIYKQNVLRLLALLLLATSQLSCTAQSTSSSKVLIQLPSANQLQASSKTFTTSAVFDWTRACFIVNVTASDIAASRPDRCDIAFGVAAGGAAPGAALSLVVPTGSARTADVYVYRRSISETSCPIANKTFAKLDHTRIVKVGSLSSFDAQTADVNISIDISAPAITASILNQLNLASSCAPPVKLTRATMSSVIIRGSGSTTNVTAQGSSIAIVGKTANIKLKNPNISF